MAEPRLYLGCPAWGMASWRGSLFPNGAKAADFLAHYAQVFNTVEGNTTFYALPKAETVIRWREQVPASFRFCFKFPSEVTHRQQLVGVRQAVHTFFDRLTPLGELLGPFMVQLPPSFAPAQREVLLRWLDTLPKHFRYAVELRHLAFFEQEQVWRELRSALAEREVDLCTMDTRALFAEPGRDEDVRAAQGRKPRMPVRGGRRSATRPLVRFVGGRTLAGCEPYLTPWIEQIGRWIGRGCTPYFFAHMPDDTFAPALARRFHERMHAAGHIDTTLPTLVRGQQASLFDAPTPG